MQTVRYARTRLHDTRNILVRLDPYLARNRTWTLYKGPKPGRRGKPVTRGMTGTGR